MLRRALSVCAVLGMVSVANAGLAISLVPSATGPYTPGQTINVDVMAQLTAGTPSVPGPAGTTSLVRVRLMQFDLADSSPELNITPISHHPTADIGPVPFWDLSGSTGCANDEAGCGLNYFIDGSISASDDILNITYTGLTSSGSLLVTLNQTTAKRVGELQITLPNTPGDFVLDVLNADEADINRGAELRWGFGSTADPTDPTSPLRASNTAGGGGIVYAPGSEGGLDLTVVPEPATLAMLGLGGLAAAYRRRRAA